MTDPSPNLSPGEELAARVGGVIRRRRSCRAFEDSPVTESDLRELVEAGVWAPSGSNAQNQRFLVVTDPAEIRRIGEARWVHPYPGSATVRERQPGGILDRAAALIIVFADAAMSDPRGAGEYHIWERLEVQNCAASIQNILLLATAKGLGSCWVSWHDAMSYTRLMTGRSWREVLADYAIPESYKIQGVVLIGHPQNRDEQGVPRGERKHGVEWKAVQRKPLDHYMIRRRDAGGPSGAEARPPGLLQRLRLRLYRAVIAVAVRVARAADIRIHRLEARIGAIAAHRNDEEP